MSEHNYGSRTVSRPLLCNVPTAPEISGWVLTKCPYCNADCWKMASEEDAIKMFASHGGATPACTRCAFNRAFHQQDMDQKRRDQEQAANAIAPEPPPA